MVDRLSPDNKTLVANVDGSPAALAEFLDRHEHAAPGETHGSALEFIFHGDDDAQVALLADIVSAGIRLKTFEERKASIERVLLDIDSKNGGGKSE